MDIKNKELVRFFKEQDVKIDLYPENRVVRFSTIKRFRDYIANECEFWDEITSGNASKYRVRFNEILSRLDSAISPNYDMGNSQNAIINAIALCKDNMNTLYSETEAAHKIKQLYAKHYLSAEAFVDFLTSSTFTSLSTKEYFYGAIQALEFFNKTSNSEIVIAKENLINQLTESFSNQIDSLDSEFLEHKTKMDSEASAFQENLNVWRDEKTSDFEEYIENKTVEFNDLIKNKTEALNNLEKTYEENLRLKKPAEYWDQLHINYNTNGDKWRWWAIGTALFMMGVLIIIFFNLPKEFFASIDDFKFETVRSILILAVIVSIGIYMLRLFVKLSLSAYHLSRDAKERYELTCFYLSLINEKAISEENRNIVLNALFSRADTGLLKNDSSPMMPESFTQQVAKLISR